MGISWSRVLKENRICKNYLKKKPSIFLENNNNNKILNTCEFIHFHKQYGNKKSHKSLSVNHVELSITKKKAVKKLLIVKMDEHN